MNVGEPFPPWGPLSWETVTLPEVLRNAGYVTMLIHDTPHLVNDGFGFDRPFHGWEMIRGQEVDRYRTDPIRRADVKFDPAKMRFADSHGARRRDPHSQRAVVGHASVGYVALLMPLNDC